MSEDITVNDLIIRAFSTIGIYAPYKIVDGTDKLTALYHLNELLDYYQFSGLYIPFYSEFFFPMTVGKDEYVISNQVGADVAHNPIIELNFVNIRYLDVLYPVSILSYDEIDRNVRNPEILSRPRNIVLQKGVDTSKVIFYNKPDFPYECRIRAKTFLSDVQLQDHLTEIPGYYHRFLRYALARELKDIYKSENWGEAEEQKYQTILTEIKNAADFPLSTDKNPVFGTANVVYDSRIGVTY